MKRAMRQLLLSDPAVAALVAGRVDWGGRPQGDAVPAISLSLISGGDVYHMGGLSRYVGAVVQIDVFAVDYDAADQTARAVNALLSGYRAGAFQGVFREGVRDLRSAGSNDPDRLHGIAQDYKINFSNLE